MPVPATDRRRPLFARFYARVSPGMEGRLQHVADATVWPLLTGGCHTARDPLPAIRGAGFEVTAARRLRFPDRRVPVPAAPHVLGVAVRR